MKGLLFLGGTAWVVLLLISPVLALISLGVILEGGPLWALLLIAAAACFFFSLILRKPY